MTPGFSFLTAAVPWGVGEGGLGRLGDLAPFTVSAALYDVDLDGKIPFFWGRRRLFVPATYSGQRRIFSLLFLIYRWRFCRRWARWERWKLVVIVGGGRRHFQYFT